MIDWNVLPNFLMIGAPKSGTTSLFDILNQHPQVYGPKAKECHFFSNDERYSKGLEWYQETFFRSGAGYPIRFEATASYLTWSDKVAPRIRSCFAGQKIRFCAIFRDPVQRAYSHYWHRVRLGHEELPFPEAMSAERERLEQNWVEFERAGNSRYGYYRAGCYASRLKPFLESFPRDHFFFLLQEDLLNDFQATMRAMLAFLDLDASVSLQPVQSNVSSLPRSRGVFNLVRKIKKTGWGLHLARIFPRQNAGSLDKTLKRLLLAPHKYPPMEAETEHQLRLRYRDEIEGLEKILGRDLSSWKAA